MSISFSSIIPHSPLLIKSIGKTNRILLEKTNIAIDKIIEKIKEHNPDTILLISSHGNINKNIFNINFSPEFEINFKDFGDFSTKHILEGDIVLAHLIKKNIQDKKNIQIIHKPILNHGTGVPLYLLTKNIPNIKILPIYCSGSSLEEHFNFGKSLQESIIKSNKKIMILASSGLSHRLTKNAPAGFSNKAAGFDQKIIENIINKNTKKIININPKLINEVEGNGIKSIIVMLGIISNKTYNQSLLSYEFPFGVGYLTMLFDSPNFDKSASPSETQA